MNTKQLTVAGVVLLGLLVVSYSIMKKDSSAWRRGNSEEKQPLLKEFDVNKVAKIALKTKDAKLTLAKKNGKWAVVDKGGYPADFKKISSFILAVRDLKVAQFPRLVESQYASLKLLPPDDKSKDSGISLTFSSADGKELVSMILGDKHMPNKKKEENPMMMFSMNRPDGRYVMLADSDAKPALVTDPLDSTTTDAVEWLDKSFLKTEKVLAVDLRGSDGKLKWRISRKTDSAPWELQGAGKKDKLKPMVMRDATSVFDNISFDDVLPASTPVKKTGLDKADAVTIKTADGFTYLVKLSKKDGKIYAKFAVAAKLAEKRKPGQAEKPDEKKKLDKEFAAKLAELKKKLKKEEAYQNWIYVLPSYSVDKILKKRSDFLEPPKKKKNNKKETKKK
jgi:hypothetical protein